MCWRIEWMAMESAVKCELWCCPKKDPEEMYGDVRRVHRAPTEPLESLTERSSQEHGSEGQHRRSASLEKDRHSGEQRRSGEKRRSDEARRSGENRRSGEVRRSESIERDEQRHSLGDLPATMRMVRGPTAPESIDETEVWPSDMKVERSDSRHRIPACLEPPKQVGVSLSTRSSDKSTGSGESPFSRVQA